MKGSHSTQINHKRYGERPSAIAASRASFGLLIGVFFNSLFRYRPRLSVSFYNEAGRLSSIIDVTLGFPFIVHPQFMRSCYVFGQSYSYRLAVARGLRTRVRYLHPAQPPASNLRMNAPQPN